jgi:recombination protein RecA
MSEIDALIDSINKKGEILFRGADLIDVRFARATSGSLSLDLMLGGGWPLNCLNEIIGNESSGKTSITLKTIAAQQALNPEHHTLWVASEDFDIAWAQTLGVDVSKMTFVMSNIMEEAYESCLRVMTQRAADAVVIDSLPALVPSDEHEKTMMEMTVGRGALLTNKFMRKALTATGRSLVEPDRAVLCIVINQWRDRIVAFGDPRTTPGGKGKNYTYMTRVEASRDEWLKHGDRQVGQVIKCQTIKNKTAPPRRQAIVDFYFDEANGHHAGEYDTVREVFTIALEANIIERKGAWFHYGSKKWNGKDAVWKAMAEDGTLVSSVDTRVRTEVLGQPSSSPPDGSGRKRRIPRA